MRSRGVVPEAVPFFPPERVVVETRRKGKTVSVYEATTYERARARGVEPDVVLVRDDGWTLGAVWEDAAAAEELWRRDWVFFVYRERAGGAWRLGRVGLEFRKLVEGTMATRLADARAWVEKNRRHGDEDR